MPDEDKTTNTNQPVTEEVPTVDPLNPAVTPTTPAPDTSSPTIDVPPPPMQDGAFSPPPPIVEEKKPVETSAPTQETGATNSAQTIPDIPPVISTSSTKSKKPVGKKMIATILGVLVLVGGIGAGVILVQNQQDIREKADTLVCVYDSECGFGETCENNKCVTITPECVNDTDCDPGETCNANGKCVSAAVTTYQCSSRGSSGTRKPLSAKINITLDDINKCKAFCENQDACKVWVTRYTCSSTGTSGGCQENPSVLEKIDVNGVSGSCISGGFDQSIVCGTQQVDIGCFGSTGADGANYAFMTYVGPTSCSSNGIITGSCLDIKAFDTEWSPITSLSSLVAGDVVRFTVAGSSSSGSFDKAKFTINGTLRTEVSIKKPGTDEFYDEYTIPEGVTTFTINAELYHSSLGWF